MVPFRIQFVMFGEFYDTENQSMSNLLIFDNSVRLIMHERFLFVFGLLFAEKVRQILPLQATLVYDVITISKAVTSML